MAAILMYHHIAVPPAWGEHRGLFISPDKFRRQMKYLRDNDYRVVTLDTVRDALVGQQDLPPRSVVITFDDGGADNYFHALPILREHGFPATVFVVAGRLGQCRQAPDWPEVAARYLTADEIAHLVRADIEIGSHTLSHVQLARIDSDRCAHELTESKRLIEQLTGRPVGWLSYPYGSFSANVVKAAKAAGYRGAVSTIRDNRPMRGCLYFLPRVMVMPDATLWRFAYYLSPWYHYMHWFKNRRRWRKHRSA